MTFDLIQSAKYKEISGNYIRDMLIMLLDAGIEFAIAAEESYLDFSPSLPEEISSSFQGIVLFALSGYSYDTIELTDETLSFEAGFGTEDFGSVVTLPILAIKQIVVDDLPIASNMASPTLTKTSGSINADKLSTDKSMEALLSNPENQELLKKR